MVGEWQVYLSVMGMDHTTNKILNKSIRLQHNRDCNVKLYKRDLSPLTEIANIFWVYHNEHFIITIEWMLWLVFAFFYFLLTDLSITHTKYTIHEINVNCPPLFISISFRSINDISCRNQIALTKTFEGRYLIYIYYNKSTFTWTKVYR